MITSAIFDANFPTLVPPYFWTSHLAAGSIVFWCMLGGVRGALEEDIDEDRDEVEDGVDAADMSGADGGGAMLTFICFRRNDSIASYT